MRYYLAIRADTTLDDAFLEDLTDELADPIFERLEALGMTNWGALADRVDDGIEEVDFHGESTLEALMQFKKDELDKTDEEMVEAVRELEDALSRWQTLTVKHQKARRAAADG